MCDGYEVDGYLVARKNDAITREEMNRLKSNCSVSSSTNNSVHALFIGHYFPPWPWTIAMPLHQIHAMELWCFEPAPKTTETNSAIMRYTKLLTPIPNVAKRERWIARYLLPSTKRAQRSMMRVRRRLSCSLDLYRLTS